MACSPTACPDPQKTREYLQLLADRKRSLNPVDRQLPDLLTARTAATPVRADADGARRSRARRRSTPFASACRQSCDLRVTIEPQLPLVLADPQGMTTALVNLLDNAIKYSPADKHIARLGPSRRRSLRGACGQRQRHRHRSRASSGASSAASTASISGWRVPPRASAWV